VGQVGLQAVRVEMRWRSAARWVVAAAVGGAALWPAPALAHVGSAPVPDSVYYQTFLTAVRPQPADVAVSVTPDGESVELRNTGAAEVVVFGYGGEPYLRVTRAGVWRNALSPTAYLNDSLFGDNSALAGGAVSAAPAWTRIAGGNSVRWHDHRIHWMGSGRPAAVDKDPGHPHLIGSWVIRATAGPTRFEIVGALRWLGKPAQVLGLPAGVVVTLVSIAVGALLLTAVSLWVRFRRVAVGGGEADAGPEPPMSPAGTDDLAERVIAAATPG
jgi:hypothetical protein